MTPDQFMLEYWKVYEGYMGRKEHLIEITTTLYLAFVSALFLQVDLFWSRYFWPAVLLVVTVALLAWCFLAWQFRLWSHAARICNSCQTLSARWLARAPEEKTLEPADVPSFPEIEVPQGLADEIRRREDRWRGLGLCEKFCAEKFKVIVYGLGLVATGVLAIRAYMAWTAQSIGGI